MQTNNQATRKTNKRKTSKQMTKETNTQQQQEGSKVATYYDTDLPGQNVQEAFTGCCLQTLIVEEGVEQMQQFVIRH